MARLTKVEQMSVEQSLQATKDILKRKRKIVWKDTKPGHLIFTSYNAKYPENTFDRTPLVLILKRNGTHTLGLNFHWLPFSLRVNLVKEIIKRNEYNIRERKPLKFTYADFKPMMRKYGYAPCIRLYINKRFGRKGVRIPANKLMEAARLRTETFTKGKYSAGVLYQRARRRGRLRDAENRRKRNTNKK